MVTVMVIVMVQIRYFIQVDLGAEHIITGLITQGRFAHGLGQVKMTVMILKLILPREILDKILGKSPLICNQ